MGLLHAMQYALLCAVVALSIVIFCALIGAPAPPATLAVALLGGLVAAFASHARHSGRWLAAVSLATGAMALISLAFFQLTVPRLTPLWTSTRIAEAAATLRRCTPGEAILTAGYVEPSVLFHTGASTRRPGGRGRRRQSRQPDGVVAHPARSRREARRDGVSRRHGGSWRCGAAARLHQRLAPDAGRPGLDCDLHDPGRRPL